MDTLYRFLGFLAILVLLLVLQRSLHRETQAIFLILTRREELAVALFSLLFFPGVLLHEASHFLMAVLLRVPTGRVSLFPQVLPGGKEGDRSARLQLGFVETAQTDWLRDALIGAAPLLTGGLLVAYAGITRLGLPLLWEALRSGGPRAVLDGLEQLLNTQADFWLWFYLAITVSSTMLPSASDRRSWLPVSLFAGLLLAASLLVGAGPWLVENLAQPLERVLGAMAVVLAISLLIHIALLLPAALLRRLLSRLTGLQIVST